jgi:hypothetical protein
MKILAALALVLGAGASASNARTLRGEPQACGCSGTTYDFFELGTLTDATFLL